MMKPLLCGVLILLPTSALAGPNLLRNGDFEQGPGKFPGVAAGWEPNDGKPHPDVDVLTTGSKHGGKRCQWLKANPKWDLGAIRQVSPYGSVKAGKSYYIQAWIKTANVRNPAGWYVFGVWLFRGDTYISDSKMPRQETNNYDWRCISWTAVAPPGADRVAAFLSRHTDGDAWYDDVFIGEIGEGPATIARTPTSFSRQVARGESLSDDMFTVRNAGGSKLKYTISSDAKWLSVWPRDGLSAGNIDNGSIRYDLSRLVPGRYSATVTIADPAATNSPQKIPVTLTVNRTSSASRPASAAAPE